MLFLETQIKKETLFKIKKNILNKKLKPCKNLTHTINGFQSENIIHLFNKNILKEIIPFFNLYEKIFHIHYISYKKNGYQVKHDHYKTEHFSFILFLNNGSGNTDFIFDNYVYSIKPIKNKLIIFSSNILHFGNKVKTKKQILVGAIEKK